MYRNVQTNMPIPGGHELLDYPRCRIALTDANQVERTQTGGMTEVGRCCWDLFCCSWNTLLSRCEHLTEVNEILG